MKFMQKSFALLAILISSLFILIGCNLATQVTITSIEIDNATVLDEYDISTIDLTSIDIIVTKSDGTTQTIPLTESLLSSGDLALLNEPGVHTITISYQGQTTQLTVTLTDITQTTYTVTFDGNGGTLVSGDLVQTIMFGASATPPVFEKEGFLMAGWTGTISNITASATITATWVIKTYTITFDGGGGTLVSGLETQTIDHGGEAYAPVFTKDGFIFDGWDNMFDVITDNVTITAQWVIPGPVYTLMGNDTYELTSYIGNPTEIYIPNSYLGKPVRTIAANALSDKSNLALVSMGTNVRTIGDFAFANCPKLKEIYIEAGGPVTVNANAFDGIDDFFRFYVFSNLLSYFKSHLPTLSNHVLTHPGVHMVTFLNNGGTLVEGETVQFVIYGKQATFPVYTLDNYHLYWLDSPAIYEDKTIIAQWTDVAASTQGSQFSLKLDGTYELTRYVGSATEVVIASHHQGIPVTSIGADAFANRPVTSVYLSEGITHIKAQAFNYCANLATIQFPTSLSKVDIYAFEDSLWYQNLPDGVVIIGDTLYSYKGNMPSDTTLTVPTGVTYITNLAFKENTNLISIVLPEGLIEIGYEAFMGCTNLATITFPSTLTHINENAFNNTAWLNNQQDGLVYAGPVLLIYKGLIPHDTLITIPNGIKGLAAGAFRNQFLLKEITLPDGLLVIEAFAFANCYELSDITLPNSITYIGYGAFEYCHELVDITLPTQLLYLGGGAFRNCIKLESIVLPDLLKSIEYDTFINCTSLTSVILGENILVIHGGAFYEATSLEHFTFNDKLQRIEKLAFFRTIIKDFILPDSLTILEDYSFAVETVYIGKNLQHFNANFARYQYLVSPDNLYYSSIDDMLFTKDGKTLIKYAFGTSIHAKVPQGTEIISTFAFTNIHQLETISLPASVSMIEEYAIADCSNLKSISIYNPAPPLLGDYNFMEMNNEWLLYVPIYTPGVYADWAVDSSRVIAMQNTYGVTFNLQHGTLISGDLMQSVAHGQSAIAPLAERDGYILSWDSSFDYITSMKIVRAVWTLLIDVHFDTFGGTLVSGDLHQQVPMGSSAVAPVLEMENFVFVGWDQSLDNITLETTFTARWEFSLFTWKVNAFNDGIIITGFQPGFQEEHLVIDYYYQHVRVTGIDYNAFRNATFLKTVTIDKNIKDIGAGILTGCTSLEELTISFKFANNYYTNFADMTYLAYYFGSSSPRTDSYPESLKRVTVHEGITKIPAMMFQNAHYLEEVILPEGITHIENSAFYNCHALISVNIPSTVEFIDYSAFYYCHNLQNMILPDTLKTIGNSAFHSNSSLTSIIIPNQVTIIGHHAFSGCSNLEEVTLSNQLITIGIEAFRGCSKLTEIILPNTLQTIDQMAFYQCTALEAIHIPENVATINQMAFSDCLSLESISVSSQNNHFASIDDVLYNKAITVLQRVAQKKVGTLIVPSTVTTLEIAAFSDCTLLTSITLPDAIYSIPMYAFKNCTSLVSINIPASCQSINNYAFENCESLIELKFPENLTSLKNYVFSGCTSLEKIEATREVPPYTEQFSFTGINPNVEVLVPVPYYLNYRHAQRWGSLMITIDAPKYTVTFDLNGGTLMEGNLVQEVYEGYDANPPYVIRPGYSRINLTPSYQGITQNTVVVYQWAELFTVTFDGNGGTLVSGDEVHIITHVGYPIAPVYERAGYKFIDWSANIYDLTETITIYAIWEEYNGPTQGLVFGFQSNNTFQVIGYTGTDSVVYIPNEYNGVRVTRIGVEAFMNSLVTKVIVGEYVQYIESKAFYGCDNLEIIYLSYRVNSLQNDAFHNCPKLTNIYVSSENWKYQSIDGILYGKINPYERMLLVVPAGKTGQLTIPEGVQAIAIDAFIHSQLSAVNLPSSIESMSSFNAFRYAYNLTSIAVSVDNPNFQSINGLLYNKAGTTLIAVPAGLTGTITVPIGVEKIGKSAFDGNKNMTHVLLPSSLQEIGDAGFAKCDGLESITIPSQVILLGLKPFQSCTQLETVRVEAITPPVSQYSAHDLFDNVTTLISIIVPGASLQNYTSAPGWSQHASKIISD